MTIDYVLDSYKKKNGLQAIRLRITVDAKPQYLPSGQFVKSSQWNKTRSKVIKHPLELQINGKLNEFKNEVHLFAIKQGNVSSKKLISLWKNKSSTGKLDFFSFYQSIIDELRFEGKISTAVSYENYLSNLKKFDSNVSFSDIDSEFIDDYSRWLSRKGNKINTIASNMKCLKVVVKKARSKKHITNFPFETYKIKTENTEKNILTYDEILRIKEIEIAPHFKGQILARDMFLFSFYSAGMRFGDVCRIKWSNIGDNEITYVMNKSKKRSGSRRSIPITPDLLLIINKYRGKYADYIFPILQGVKDKDLEGVFQKIKIGNNAVNRSWKIFCKKNNFNYTTFHSSKHSFADYCVHSGIDIRTISKLLGHTRLNTTEVYLKDFYKKVEDEAINKLFG